MNKKLMVFVIVGLFALTFVAALTYYTVTTVTFNVNQPISITGDGPQTVPCDAGQTCLGDPITVENSADYEKTIVITDDSIPEIEVNYVGRLELDNKDSNWATISDGKEGELFYFITGDEFGYHFEAKGLNDVEYALLYYADDTDRFNVWGGSPAVLIGSGTASSGELTLEGSTLIGDLPFASDWNVDGTPNYCNYNNGFDDFEHCYGAKIWLVPMSDYNIIGQTVYPNWNPTEWLFETDLIYYFENSNGEYTIGGESFVEFYPLFTVDPYLPTGTHIIDITIA